MKMPLLLLVVTSAMLLSFCKDDDKRDTETDGDAPIILQLLPKAETKYGYDIRMHVEREQIVSNDTANIVMDLIAETTYKSATTESTDKGLDVTYQRIAINMQSPLINVQYDSKDTTGSNPALYYVADAMVQRSLKIIVNEQENILKEAGLTGIINGPGWTYAGELFACLFEMRQQSISFYPGNPVRIGDSWTCLHRNSVGGVPIGTADTYKLTRVSNGIAEIALSGRTSAGKVPEEQANIAEDEVSGARTGILNIIIATGLIKDAEIRQSLKCYIIVEGNKVPVRLSARLTITGRQK